MPHDVAETSGKQNDSPASGDPIQTVHYGLTTNLAAPLEQLSREAALDSLRVVFFLSPVGSTTSRKRGRHRKS